MDRIIILIILYVIFKKFYNFLKNALENEEKLSRPSQFKKSYPPCYHPTTKIPATNSPHPLQGSPKLFHPSLKKEKFPLNEMLLEGQDTDKSKRTRQREKMPLHDEIVKQKRVESYKRYKPEISIEPKIKKKKEGIHFDDLSIVKEGIILSEILRPPVSKRNPFLPPYMRG